ncbi:hypothetical protein HMPREF0758_1878 [Serratia odorifera DSM 4582]|uniref:Uncharacterized protein n=1 Tax=Serratia odorifera DSM 4582 TaxID=667129 RepID=D4E1A4_SEROD|nr:hypothetical protein HMPREF0758_1878 [Serratia odorifera DSM 4582]
MAEYYSSKSDYFVVCNYFSLVCHTGQNHCYEIRIIHRRCGDFICIYNE